MLNWRSFKRITVTLYWFEKRIPKATVQRHLQENNRNSGALWTFKQQLVYKVRVHYVKVTIANFGISYPSQKGEVVHETNSFERSSIQHMSGWPNWLGIRLQSSDGCCWEMKSCFLVNLFFPEFFVWQIFCQICLSWKTRLNNKKTWLLRTIIWMLKTSKLMNAKMKRDTMLESILVCFTSGVLVHNLLWN